MKKRWIALAAVFMTSVFLVNGCANEQKETEKTVETTEAKIEESETTEAETEVVETAVNKAAETVSAAGWDFTVEDFTTNATLENVSVELGYTGVETSDYVKAAEDGNVFCLVKLLIVKDGSTEAIDWENFKLIDGAGNEYLRMEDEFITDLGMARMPGTALNFGTNEGWIAFEIPETATDLKLNYEFASESFNAAL